MSEINKEINEEILLIDKMIEDLTNRCLIYALAAKANSISMERFDKLTNSARKKALTLFHIKQKISYGDQRQTT
jgi:limonene-1,2-epoxide hydrolase